VRQTASAAAIATLLVVSLCAGIVACKKETRCRVHAECTGGKCESGRCVKATRCVLDDSSVCRRGEKCIRDHCVPVCESDLDCPEGWACSEAECHEFTYKKNGTPPVAAARPREALKAGYDEAIMLNSAGLVAECTGENIYIVKDGRIITPPLSAGALDGITRDSVITIARDLGIEVVEANIPRSDLYLADEAFLSGTAAEIVPIREIDDREVGEPGPITRKVQETYFATVRGEVDAYKGWLEHVGT
jgi:hypothetical protein